MTFPIKDTKPKKPEAEAGRGALARRLAVSAGMGFALFGLLILAAAGICLALDAAQDRLNLVAIPLAGVAAFAAGYLNVRPLRRQGLVFGMLAAAALYLPLLLAAMAVTHAAPGVNAVLLLLAMLPCGAAGGIFSANRAGTSSSKRSAKARNRR